MIFLNVNKHNVLCFIFILFHTIIYSCNSSEEQTFEEMLRRDSVELSQMIQRASESKIEHLFVFSGRYESGSKPQCFEILRKLSNSRSLRFEGSLNYWDDITIDAVYADSIENTFIDSLNIENDLKSLFKSCKKIADGKEIILLALHNKIIGATELLETKNYVEMLFYYNGKHYLLVSVDDSKLYDILECRKRLIYKDLDIIKSCQRISKNIYLIGFSSQDEFFKDR